MVSLNNAMADPRDTLGSINNLKTTDKHGVVRLKMKNKQLSTITLTFSLSFIKKPPPKTICTSTVITETGYFAAMGYTHKGNYK